MGYEIQYHDKDGEPIGYDTAPNLDEARAVVFRTLSKFLPPNYELRYAQIITTCDGRTLSAYQTKPEGTIVQIDIHAIPWPD